MAMENDKVKADVVEVSEFPHLGQKYMVMGVPKIVINDKASIEGAVPEADFVREVMSAVG
jgi:predicted DsbA family dithiol-disulfide isomerase